MDGLAREDQTPDNMGFEFISDWTYLPEGIYFDDDETLSGNYLFELRTDRFDYPLDPASPNSGPDMRPMGVVMFRPNGRGYMMAGNTTTGKWWQDRDASKIHLTSTKYYEQSGGTLGAAQTIPGTNTVVEIRNKTGQVHLWSP